MSYTPKHPGLFRYDPANLGPALAAGGDPMGIVSEKAEQLYMFQLFTPEYCKLLIEEAEHSGRWRTEADVEAHPFSDFEEVSLPDTTQHLSNMPGLDEVYDEVVRRHLGPLMTGLWRTFKLQKVSRPYMLRYSVDAIKSMDLHHDLETVTMVVYLNTEFEGGGTYFPRWKYHTGKPRPGTAIIYPGGLSHEHEGKAITAGTRYLMCGSFY
jgi:hypothetical protein